jgi:hypothetical protein
MSFSMIASLIHFISCHAGPAAHFAEFVPLLTQKNHKVEISATGPAAEIFYKHRLPVREFSLDQDHLIDTLIERSSSADIVMTDLGHPLMGEFHKTLGEQGAHYAYYDNPEPFVPGGYSAIAAEVMRYAKGVLFANAKLSEEILYGTPEEAINLPLGKRHPLGYYPIEAALRIKKVREDRMPDDRGKVFVYFGGNNEEYFSKAFPAFLALLKESGSSEESVLFLQQHPGARRENRDGEMALSSALQMSTMSSEEAQIRADAIFYFQTSMAPQFVLAGIPTFQVGHEPYADLLVRTKVIPVITSSDDFKEALEGRLLSPCSGDFLHELGISIDWQKNLDEFFQRARPYFDH